MKKIIISKKEIINYNKQIFTIEDVIEEQIFRRHFGYINYDFNKPLKECTRPTEEHRIYAYLSEKVENTTILDVGTLWGKSARALSMNKTNRVITFDIVKPTSYDYLISLGIDSRIGNFMEDSSIDYSNIDIILIDVDPHDGLQEPPMLEFLERKNWSGLLLLDDICTDKAIDMRFPGMRIFWDNIKQEKYDLTDIGNPTGTGLVNFGNKFEIEIID